MLEPPINFIEGSGILASFIRYPPGTVQVKDDDTDNLGGVRPGLPEGRNHLRKCAFRPPELSHMPKDFRGTLSIAHSFWRVPTDFLVSDQSA